VKEGRGHALPGHQHAEPEATDALDAAPGGLGALFGWIADRRQAITRQVSAWAPRPGVTGR
jgi:hypothetical protein